MTMMTMAVVTLETDNYKIFYDQVIVTIDTHNTATDVDDDDDDDNDDDDNDNDDDDNVTKML